MQWEGDRYFHLFCGALVLREVVLGHLCPDSVLKPIRKLVQALDQEATVSEARLGFTYFEVKPNERLPTK